MAQNATPALPRKIMNKTKRITPTPLHPPKHPSLALETLETRLFLSVSPQILYLDFDGQRVFNRFGDFDLEAPYVDIPAYNLASFGWAGREQESIEHVLAFIREDYAPYNILVTDQPPTAAQYTTIYVGGNSDWQSDGDDIIGLATYDTGNRDPSNYGFVFPQEMADYADTAGSLLNFSEYLANLITHEAAHTFGADHIDDESALMNPYLSFYPRRLMFGRGPRTGTSLTQDSQTLLGRTLGYASSADDYGDTLLTAQHISDSTTSLTGILERRDDIDVFTLTPSVNGTLTISVQTSLYTNLDAYLQITDSLDLLLENGAIGGSSDAALTLDVVAGRQYTIYVAAAAGNSSGTYTLDVPSLDTIEPSAPGSPTISPINDSGISSSDAITNINQPRFTWTAALDTAPGSSGIAGYFWRVDGGSWSNLQTTRLARPDALDDGAHLFEVYAIDYAGNTGPVASSSFVIDTVIATPTLTGIDPATSLESNTITTNQTALTLTGYAEPESLIYLYDNYRLTTLAPLTSPGTFFLTLTDLAEGPHTFTILARDPAGNQAASTQTVAVAIDTTAPQVTRFALRDRIPASATSQIVLTFSEPLDPAALDNPALYSLIAAQGDNDFDNGSTTLAITAADYLPDANTLTLTVLSAGFLENDLYRLAIPNPDPITDLAGNTLDGDADLLPAGPYLHQFTVNALALDISNTTLQLLDTNGARAAIRLIAGSGTLTLNGLDLQLTQLRNRTIVTGANFQIFNIDITSDDPARLLLSARTPNQPILWNGLTAHSLSQLSAVGFELLGDISLTGSLASLRLDAVAPNSTVTTASAAPIGSTIRAGHVGPNVAFDLAGLVRRFDAYQFPSGSLAADDLGRLRVRTGSVNLDITARQGDILTFATLGNIAGALSAADSIGSVVSRRGDIQATLRAADDIRSVSALNLDHALLSAGQSIQRVIVRGDITDSYILAGYDIGPDAAFGLQNLEGQDQPGNGNIGLVVARGRFARSYICAGVLPHAPLPDELLPPDQLPYIGTVGAIGPVRFVSLDLDPLADFGLYAASSITTPRIAARTPIPTAFQTLVMS